MYKLARGWSVVGDTYIPHTPSRSNSNSPLEFNHGVYAPQCSATIKKYTWHKCGINWGCKKNRLLFIYEHSHNLHTHTKNRDRWEALCIVNYVPGPTPISTYVTKTHNKIRLLLFTQSPRKFAYILWYKFHIYIIKRV